MKHRQRGTDQSTAGLSAERIARNDAIFRHANDGISEAAEAGDFGDPVPFVCECADPDCRQIIQLTLQEYSEIRQDPRTFLNAPGHQAASQGWAQVVETHRSHVVVTKVGPAGEVAEQLEGERNPATAAVEVDRRHRRGEKAASEAAHAMDEREQRVLRNEALFRRVNERLERLNLDLPVMDDDGDRFDIVCECGDGTCVQQISIQIAEYFRIRRDPTLFVLVPGHEDATAEAVVEADQGSYVVVRKPPGGPAELASESAPDS